MSENAIDASGEAKLPKVFKYFNVPRPLPRERNAKIRAKCRLCDSEISGKIKSTSNFITHLKSRHRNEHREFEEEKHEESRSRTVNTPVLARPGLSRPITVSKIVSISKPTSPLQPSERQTDPSWMKVTMSIVKFITTFMLPVPILDTDAFKEMVHTLNPRHQLVTRKTLMTTVLPKLELETFCHLKSAIQEAKFCSVGVDIWTCRNKRSFLVITVHFIDSDWNLRCYVLCCAYFKGRHTGSQIVQRFSEVVDKFGLLNKIFRLITDHAWNMLVAKRFVAPSSTQEASDGEEDLAEEFDDDSAFYEEICFGVDWLGCYAHGLQLCIRDAFKMVESASKLMKKVNTAANIVRRLTCNMDVIDDDNINVYNCTEIRWNCELRLISSLLAVDDAVLYKYVPAEHIPTEEERKYLNEIVDLLIPFKEATEESQYQDSVSISSVLPSSRGIRVSLTLFSASVASAFQEALLESFGGRFDWLENSSLHGCATILDPKYGLRWTESASESESWIKILESETQRFIDVHSGSVTVPFTPAAPPEKRVFSFMKEAIPVRGGLRGEIDEYLMAIQWHQGGCLDFWKRSSLSFPNLSQFAMALLATPASSAAIERLFSIAGKINRPDRLKLHPSSLEKFLFLKANWDLV